MKMSILHDIKFGSIIVDEGVIDAGVVVVQAAPKSIQNLCICNEYRTTS